MRCTRLSFYSRVGRREKRREEERRENDKAFYFFIHRQSVFISSDERLCLRLWVAFEIISLFQIGIYVCVYMRYGTSLTPLLLASFVTAKHPRLTVIHSYVRYGIRGLYFDRIDAISKLV